MTSRNCFVFCVRFSELLLTSTKLGLEFCLRFSRNFWWRQLRKVKYFVDFRQFLDWLRFSFLPVSIFFCLFLLDYSSKLESVAIVFLSRSLAFDWCKICFVLCVSVSFCARVCKSSSVLLMMRPYSLTSREEYGRRSKSYILYFITIFEFYWF